MSSSLRSVFWLLALFMSESSITTVSLRIKFSKDLPLRASTLSFDEDNLVDIVFEERNVVEETTVCERSAIAASEEEEME
jgi:hypothetical protein